MKPTIKIQIPKPCQQHWEAMTPGAGGRHCIDCAKTVTDFTRMSNAQLLEVMSGSAGRYGQFREDQSGRELVALPVSKRFCFALFYKVAAGFLLVFSAVKVAAQENPEINALKAYTDTINRSVGENLKNARYYSVSGNVKNSRNQPLENAIVKVEFQSRVKTTTTTDKNGVFELLVSDSIYNKEEWMIVVYQTGYQTNAIEFLSADLPDSLNLDFELRPERKLDAQVVMHVQHMLTPDGRCRTLITVKKERWWQFWKRH